MKYTLICIYNMQRTCETVSDDKVSPFQFLNRSSIGVYSHKFTTFLHVLFQYLIIIGFI